MRITKIVILVSLLLPILSPNGFSKDNITWLTMHWPPFMELDESRKVIVGGQRGIQLQLLQNGLPEYEHINQEMPWSRFWFLVKKGNKICNCMSLKNKEREEIAIFSIPISVALPNQIVVRRETFEQLGSPKSYSLIKLMQQKELKGLLISQRSYSHDIDMLLQEYEGGSNIVRDFVDEQTYLKLLDKKRTDYILEYPYVVTRTIDSELPELKDNLIGIPISEIDQFYYIYVACPKNEWGKTVIGKINKSLKALRITEPFRNALGKSYKGENLETILKFYDTHLTGKEKNLISFLPKIQWPQIQLNTLFSFPSGELKKSI